MKIEEVKVGDVLYFQPEELTLLVVMVGEHGFRYIEPMNPEVDDNGNLKSTYIIYDALSEWTTSLGSITNISATLMGKKS